MKYILSTIITIIIIGGIGMFFYSQNNAKIPTANINNQSTVSESPENQKIITAFGDSLTAGYNLPIEQSYPSQLQTKLDQEGYTYKVVNSGSSGDTTAAALSRIDWVLKTKPDIIILQFGANDAFRGIDPAITKKNISLMIEQIQKENIQILLAGMYAPRNLGKTYYEQFDAIYLDLAEQYNVELIPFILDGIALKPELNLNDGIHPTEEGYKIMVEKNVWPKLEKMLEK